METSELLRRMWVGYWVLSGAWLLYTVVRFGILAEASGDAFLKSLSTGIALGVMPPVVVRVVLRALEAFIARKRPPA